MNLLAFFAADYSATLWTILVAIVCNTSCAILGCFLVLRRLSLLGDAISHSILPGIALAFLLGGKVAFLPLFLGAFAFGILTAVLTQALHSLGNVPEDSSMGVIFTSLFAAGVLLMRYAGNNNLHVDQDCFLYGQIEFITLDTVPIMGLELPRALGSLGLALIATVGFTGVCWKELKIAAFDPAIATAMGYSAALLHYALMGMVAGVTVASFEAVGSILVIAMLIVPAATAQLLADRLWTMVLAAVGVGVVAAVGGYLAAVGLNTSVAGMMAVVAGATFLVVYLAAPRHGLVSRMVHNLRLSMRIVGEDLLAALYREEESARLALVRSTGGKVEPAFGLRECVRRSGGGLAAWLALPGLLRKGMLARAGAGIGSLALTDAGRQLAGSLVRSHRLWERFLEKNFELPLDHLHEPASRIEHFIGPDLQAKLAAELDRPGVDPHGRTIPPPSP